MKRDVVLVVVLGWLFMGACKPAPIGPVNHDTILYLQAFDKNQNNLLDPKTPNFYSESDVRIFYIEDGASVEVYNIALQFPRNFFFFNSSNSGYIMKLFLD